MLDEHLVHAIVGGKDPDRGSAFRPVHWTLPAAFSRTTPETTAVSDLSGV
jgi:hypothetical protein